MEFMKTAKYYLYIVAFLFVVIIFFFKKDLPVNIANVSWIIAAVLLFILIIFDSVTKKRND